jgi:hypothetical protein
VNFLRKWWARRVLRWNDICPKHMKNKKYHDSRYDIWDLSWECDDCFMAREVERKSEYLAAQKKIAERIARAKEVLK